MIKQFGFVEAAWSIEPLSGVGLGDRQTGAVAEQADEMRGGLSALVVDPEAPRYTRVFLGLALRFLYQEWLRIISRWKQMAGDCRH